jgi:uncharacterized protein (DUF433 family)
MNSKRKTKRKTKTKTKTQTKIAVPDLPEKYAHRSNVYEVNDKEGNAEELATHILSKVDPEAVVAVLDSKGSFVSFHTYPDIKAAQLKRAIRYDKLLDAWKEAKTEKRKKEIQKKLDRMDQQDSRTRTTEKGKRKKR